MHFFLYLATNITKCCPGIRWDQSGTYVPTVLTEPHWSFGTVLIPQRPVMEEWSEVSKVDYVCQSVSQYWSPGR